MSKITILGINGHIGHHAARAFVAAGWEVIGMGRSNRHPIPGVTFMSGDAENLGDLQRAIGDSEVVLNALNLPYHTWDKGRLEAQVERVITAVGARGRTLLMPVSIYNYAASDRVITPDLPQHPQTPRGEIRKRIEDQLKRAADRGDMQVLLLRSGDYFGPESTGDWFDQAMMLEAHKGKVQVMGTPGIAHAWAYLPDLGRAFERLASVRHQFGAHECFHYAGFFVTPEAMGEAIAKAAPRAVRVGYFPRIILSVIGVVQPMMREIAKMGYLWTHAMALRDPRLEALLGADFGTPFEAAVAATARPFFQREARAA